MLPRSWHSPGTDAFTSTFVKSYCEHRAVECWLFWGHYAAQNDSYRRFRTTWYRNVRSYHSTHFSWSSRPMTMGFIGYRERAVTTILSIFHGLQDPWIWIHRLSRNDGNYQFTLCYHPKRAKISFTRQHKPEINAYFVVSDGKWVTAGFIQLFCKIK